MITWLGPFSHSLPYLFISSYAILHKSNENCEENPKEQLEQQHADQSDFTPHSLPYLSSYVTAIKFVQ